MAYWLVKALLTPILRLLYRVRVEGLEHLPADGPVILASNHVSFCDSIFLPMVLRRRVTFAAKAEYFDDPRKAWFFRAAGQIPIRRGGGRASDEALDAASAVLEAGGVFGIYPEGTRSPDGRLYRGHTGVARLALRCRCPVVPVAMLGTAEAQPVGRRVPRPFLPITVRLGPALRFDRREEGSEDRAVLREITDQVMEALRSLSGQEYVAGYSTPNRAAVPAPAAADGRMIDPRS